MSFLQHARFRGAVQPFLISLVVIGAYLLEHKIGRSLFRYAAEGLEGWPRLLTSAFLYYGIWTVLVPLVVAAIVVGPRRCISALGLNGSVWIAAKIGLIATAILPITYAFIAPLNQENLAQDIFAGAILPGIGEEVLFRGMLFGLLFRFAGWGFLPAALLGASLFGIGHFYQGSSLAEFLGIFGITGLAALWWSWIYIEWDNNIWMPAAFHILMNMYFSIFDVATGTLGSWSFFAIRAAVCLISLGLTVRHAKKRGYFRISGWDWIWQKV
jgi:membrane protease YdiL (CAAX protease family)